MVHQVYIVIEALRGSFNFVCKSSIETGQDCFNLSKIAEFVVDSMRSIQASSRSFHFWMYCSNVDRQAMSPQATSDGSILSHAQFWLICHALARVTLPAASTVTATPLLAGSIAQGPRVKPSFAAELIEFCFFL